MKKTNVLFTILCVVLAGCQDYALSENKAAIEVKPDSLDFGFVTTGFSAEREFQIKNVGSATCQIERFTWESEADYLSLDRGMNDPFTLNKGDSVDVVVTYAPDTDMTELTNAVLVYHELSDEAEVVELLMSAGAEPDIEADPDFLAFGSINSNETRNENVVLSNVGDGLIIIDDVSLTGDSPFTLNPEDSVGAELASGEVTSINITFTPNGATGNFTGEVLVASNDPDESELLIPITGSSGVPSAYCSVEPNPVFAIFETATFHAYDVMGNMSSDPNYSQNQLTFDWTLLAQPTGSTASLPGGFDPDRNLSPDMPGTYTGELVVCNPNEDCSDPCVVDLEAITSQDLWVEMYWTQAPDDMDLHLIGPGGSFNSQMDCYYANMNPDWGVLGDPSDDPSLDLDDIPGTGPENINVAMPADGTYTVAVHDYSGSNWPSQDITTANQTTVNVWISGQLADTLNCSITGDDTVTGFFTIEYVNSQATVTALNCSAM